MKNKIIELRAILPIPMMEAKQLLEANDNDVETCVYLYTAKAIKEICTATGCDSKMAEEYYKREKYDINRAISFINDAIYDKNYQPISGIDHTSLQYIKDWIYLMEKEDFAYSLSYSNLQQTVETMYLLPKLKEIGEMIAKTKTSYNLIFDGYTNASPIEDFIRRNRKLDDDLHFQVANEQIPLQLHYIKDEVSRHWRNT